MSIRITSQEAHFAIEFFELIGQGDPIDGVLEAIIIDQIPEIETPAEVLNVIEEKSTEFIPTPAEQKPKKMSASEALEKRKITLKQANLLLSARKFYEAANKANAAGLGAKNYALSLRALDKRLLEKSNSVSYFSALGLKAKILLDIFEKSNVQRYLIENPDLIKKYHFTFTPLGDIEFMVNEARRKIGQLQHLYPKKATKNNEEFEALSTRIELLRKPANEPPILAPQPEDRMDLDPNTQMNIKKVLGKVKQGYEDTISMTNEDDKLIKYICTLSLIEGALKDPQLQTFDKAAFILKKCQILFRIGHDRSAIKTMIQEVQEEIDIAQTKRVSWKSIIYPLNQVLKDIENESSRKRKIADELEPSSRPFKKRRESDPKK